uniref:SFRICE_022432 n=1 Tax=Spodoptera frugiperda TaxID=7108 RepID=A0A2H1WF93_SPOFR
MLLAGPAHHKLHYSLRGNSLGTRQCISEVKPLLQLFAVTFSKEHETITVCYLLLPCISPLYKYKSSSKKAVTVYSTSYRLPHPGAFHQRLRVMGSQFPYILVLQPAVRARRLALHFHSGLVPTAGRTCSDPLLD